MVLLLVAKLVIEASIVYVYRHYSRHPKHHNLTLSIFVMS